MKRLWSWIVLLLLTVAFYWAEYWIWALVVLFFSFLYKLSHILFFIVIFGGGTGIIICLFFAMAGLAQFVVEKTQQIYLSENGTRYSVVGIAAIVFFVANLIFLMVMVINDQEVSNGVTQLLASLTMIGYGIALIGAGKEAAENDGPPVKQMSDGEYCPNCGGRTAEGKYCQHCGKRLR